MLEHPRDKDRIRIGVFVERSIERFLSSGDSTPVASFPAIEHSWEVPSLLHQSSFCQPIRAEKTGWWPLWLIPVLFEAAQRYRTGCRCSYLSHYVGDRAQSSLVPYLNLVAHLHIDPPNLERSRVFILTPDFPDENHNSCIMRHCLTS